MNTKHKRYIVVIVWVLIIIICSIVGCIKANEHYDKERAFEAKVDRVEQVLKNNKDYKTDQYYNQTYYNIGLSKDMQDIVFTYCIKYDIDPEYVLAVMKIESGFKKDTVSSTNDYGLMQINASNKCWLSKALGRTVNLLDPKDNIECGVYMLSHIKQNTFNKVLMVYNGGGAYAKYKWSKGIFTTSYTDKVNHSLSYIKERKYKK